jgi:hypothetical protein
MENLRYSAKRLAEILDVTPKQVEAAMGRRDGFTPADLPALRERLKKWPRPV